MSKVSPPPKDIPIFSYQRKPEEKNLLQITKAIATQGPLAGSLHILSLDLDVGDNLISHNLGRIPEGRILIFQSAASDFYDGAITRQTWTINSSAACAVKVLFF